MIEDDDDEWDDWEKDLIPKVNEKDVVERRYEYDPILGRIVLLTVLKWPTYD